MIDKLQTTSETPKVYGYVRASTAQQKNSPEIQREEIEKFGKTIKGAQWEKCFSEHVSGKTPFLKREEAGKLAEILKKGDHVIVHNFDRIGRNMRDVVGLMDWFVSRGINLHVLNMGGMRLDLTSAVGRMLVNIMAAFAQMDNELRAERIREAIMYRKLQGLPVNGAKKPGYRFEKAKRKGIFKRPARLVRDEDEVRIINMLHKMYHEDGFSVRRLEEFCKRGNLQDSHGNGWSKSAIHRAIQAKDEALAEGRDL